MHCKELSYVWKEAVIWAYVLVAIAGDVGKVCRRYMLHALLVLVACAVSWVLSEWYVEGAFEPLPYFIRELYVWHFVVVR